MASQALLSVCLSLLCSHSAQIQGLSLPEGKVRVKLDHDGAHPGAWMRERGKVCEAGGGHQRAPCGLGRLSAGMASQICFFFGAHLSVPSCRPMLPSCDRLEDLASLVCLQRV